jgi:peptidyl-prolyl cis-trans isomerase B (cyclophilin B)
VRGTPPGLSFAAVSRPAALVLTVMLALVGAAGCGADKEGLGKTTGPGRTTAKEGTAGSTAATAGARPTPATCQRVAAPTPRGTEHLSKPTTSLSRNATWLANVATSCGPFTITLDVKRAPKTASSFASLARLSFYDGLTFHRVVNGFVIQGGDPRGDGSGGPGYQTVEPPPSGLRYTRGVVAMAKQEIEDPGTAGSQFFVVVGPDAQLPADYALVGRVTSGLDTIDRIAVVPTDPNTDRPLQPVVIDSVRIVQARKR